MTRYKRLLFGVVMLALLLGCASSHQFVRSTYNIMLTSSVSYDTVMTTARKLYDDKIISDGVWSTIVGSARTYATAHNIAVEALAKYVEKSEEMSEREIDALELQMRIAADALRDILNLVKPYIYELKSKEGEEV